MSRASSCKWLGLLSLALAIPLQAQTPLPKPTFTRPTYVITGPSSLNAWSPAVGHVMQTWPAVAGAEKYRITRIDNTGTPEVTIAEAPYSWFVFEGTTCKAGTSQPTCIFDDMSFIRLVSVKDINPGSEITLVEGTIYPHNVTSGKLYTYRVWSIFAGPVVSPPSPPATVQAK
jgi:hypothetical protein